MLKWTSHFIIIIGILFVGIGGYQYFKTIQMQTNSLTEAYEVLKYPPQTVSPKSNHSIIEEVVFEEFDPQQGEAVGILSIPKINAELPIVEGTNEDELEKGVGHFQGTAYPNGNDQIVLSGHRDTVFQRMGELTIGDTFIVKLPYGSFIYEIESTKVVSADDRSVIKSTAPEEVLVVTTCYPFTFVGNAPDRYILTAKPVKK